jgi:hypothetical protein
VPYKKGLVSFKENFERVWFTGGGKFVSNRVKCEGLKHFIQQLSLFVDLHIKNTIQNIVTGHLPKNKL